MTNEIREDDLKPDTLSKKLTLGAIGSGTLGALLFIIGKMAKNSGSKYAKICSAIGKICIAIGIYILAIAVYFSQNDNNVSPGA